MDDMQFIRQLETLTETFNRMHAEAPLIVRVMVLGHLFEHLCHESWATEVVDKPIEAVDRGVEGWALGRQVFRDLHQREIVLAYAGDSPETESGYDEEEALNAEVMRAADAFSAEVSELNGHVGQVGMGFLYEQTLFASDNPDVEVIVGTLWERGRTLYQERHDLIASDGDSRTSRTRRALSRKRRKH